VPQFREFKMTDMDRCVQVFMEVFSREPWGDQWPTPQRARDYLLDLANAPGFRGFVAHEGSAILGMCFGHKVRWWAGDEYFVDEFCIDSDMQQRGLGTQLMTHSKKALMREGVQFMFLLTDRQTPAESFYVRQGFQTSAKTVFMYKRLEDK
jgi:aminoglycoside 6'-N-acetyltransferase I